MNWEQAYREECRKLEDVRNELKEREEHICEMQLLIDQANEKLKVHFSDVIQMSCKKCGSKSFTKNEMEAKNFRIGNIVYYHGTNGPRNNINKLDAEDIKLMSEDSKYLALHEEIELNEKLLIRLGFTKNGVLYENGKFAIKEWEVGHQQQWQVFWSDSHLGQYNDMKLHELQNLFFALTGTELQYEELP